jgi:hypothetical protein
MRRSDAVILQVLVLLTLDSQEFTLISNQRVDGNMIGGSIGSFNTIYKRWPGLSVEWKWEFLAHGLYWPWNVGSIDWACISICTACKHNVFFPLEE